MIGTWDPHSNVSYQSYHCDVREDGKHRIWLRVNCSSPTCDDCTGIVNLRNIEGDSYTDDESVDENSNHVIHHECAKTAEKTSVLYTCGQSVDNRLLMQWTMEEELRELRAKQGGDEPLPAPEPKRDRSEEAAEDPEQIQDLGANEGDDETPKFADNDEDESLRHDEL